MAKMKTFAVDIVVPVKITVYVTSRRANGAVEKLKTDEGWCEAVRYSDDDSPEAQFRRYPPEAIVENVRETG
jgi:hypothetical protein